MSTRFPYPFRPLDYMTGPHDNTGANMLGLGTNDATQRYICGTRKMLWDGSVFKYCKAGATLTSYQSAVWDEATGAAVSYESLPGGESAGSTEVTLTQGSITEDQYTGGYILIFHATGDGGLYGIQGNEATKGTTTKLTLDRQVPVALTSSDSMELYANPYSSIAQGDTSGLQGFIGLPMAILTDLYYGWIKTWGPAFCSPQTTVGAAQKNGCWFRDDGSINVHSDIDTGTTSQYAGYVMVGDAAGDGPIIMLQVSI